MPRKSNKTSYVMNLITNGEPGEEEQEQQEQEFREEETVQKPQNGQDDPGGQAAVQSAPGPDIRKVIVVDEDREGEKLSEEIKNQLESQLADALKKLDEEEESKDQPVLQPAGALIMPEEKSEQARETPGRDSLVLQPDQEQAEQNWTEQNQPEQSQPEQNWTEQNWTEQSQLEQNQTEQNWTEQNQPQQNQPEQNQPVQNQPEQEINIMSEEQNVQEQNSQEQQSARQTENVVTEAANTTPESSQPSQPSYRMVNVMEQLVGRLDLDKYIREYEVCTCPRCRADVHALILTTLPSKYVVMNESSISPMLNFYESRRKTDIFTATLKACLEVKENPRHDGDVVK